MSSQPKRSGSTSRPADTVSGFIRITVTDENGVETDAPEQVYRLAEQALSYVAEGRDAALVVIDRDLTTQEAADILGVSRPHLIKMLDSGEIAHYRVGAHRRIDVRDVIAYKYERDARRREALAKLSAESQDLGLY